MALQGSISDFGLSDIFQLILHQKKTGMLNVKGPEQEFNIFFENGMVILGEPTNQDPLNRIGDRLVRSGRITADQLQDALKQQKKTKEKVGQILLDMGLIGKKDLVKGLGFQVKETLYGLFRIKEGEYSFKPTEITYDKNFWEPINTEFILMEGVRRVDEWPMIEKVIPSFDLIFGKVEENAGKIQGVKKEEEEELDDIFDEGPSEDGLFLTKDEMGAYEAVDGNRSVRTIIDSLGIGDFETCKALNNLLTAGLIQTLKAPQGAVSVARPLTIKKHGVRKPIFSLRNIGTCILFVGVVLLVLIRYDQYNASFTRSDQAVQIYRELLLNSQYNRVAFEVQAFYDKYGRIPKDLDELERSSGNSEGLFEDPWGRNLTYESQEERSFVIGASRSN